MIWIYKDGKDLALRTDADSEVEFTSQLVEVFASLPWPDGFTAHDANGWLRAYVDICCKYRGYKAPVREERIISAGKWGPGSDPIAGMRRDRSVVYQSSCDRCGLVCRSDRLEPFEHRPPGQDPFLDELCPACVMDERARALSEKKEVEGPPENVE